MNYRELAYANDFTRYYYDQDDALKTSPNVSGIPEEIENYFSILEAIRYLQKLGCWGKSLHSEDPEVSLARQVLKIAVEKYGEVVEVFRGHHGEFCGECKILYGATDRNVAAFYGPIIESRIVKGLRTLSTAESVVNPEDVSAMDEEIIFFPETVI